MINFFFYFAAVGSVDFLAPPLCCDYALALIIALLQFLGDLN